MAERAVVAPDEIQRGYRAAALRILGQIEEEEPDDVPTKREALLYLAEALKDLAETLADG